MLKAAPVCVALGAAAALALNMALSNDNWIFKAFGSKFHAPEVIVCGVVAIGGIVASVVVARREKRMDVG
jgi:hypothetical protein